MNIGVSYDPKYNLAMITGPGGFTQQQMEEHKARAIAQALGVQFVMCKPGTTIPAETP